MVRNPSSVELLVLANLCEGLLLIGRDREMRQPTERLLHLAESRGAKFHAGLAHRLLGEMQLLETDTALPHFNEAIAIFRQIKAENELAKAYLGMGRLHKFRGEYAEARRYLTQALEIFERLGTLIEPDKVRKELAELPASA